MYCVRLVCVGVGLALVSCREPTPGTLEAYAQQAKREGRDSFSFGETPDIIGQKEDLRTLTRSFSTIVATPSRVAAATSTDASHIYTWNVFTDAIVLSHANPSVAKPCHLTAPKELSLTSGEIVMRVGGGTVVVDGIRITMAPLGWSPKGLSGRYVFFAVECAGPVVILPMLGDEVFEVTASALTPVHGARFPFHQQMAALKTLDHLKEFLASSKSGPTPSGK
jgi:hypothetical protein